MWMEMKKLATYDDDNDLAFSLRESKMMMVYITMILNGVNHMSLKW